MNNRSITIATISSVVFAIAIYQADRVCAQNKIPVATTSKLAGNQYCAASPVGLVSWYRGEGDVLDPRSRNNGTLVNETAFVSGQVGQAFSFDGVDDSADLGNWFSLNDFTLSMWVKPGASQVQYADIIDNNHVTGVSWVLQQDGTNTNSYGFSGTTFFSLTANVWQHLVITHEGSGSVNVYRDGLLVATGSHVINYNGTQFLRLGRWGNGLNLPSNRNWNGQLDEFAVFDRALTANEVQSIFSSSSTGMCSPTATTAPSGLTGWWSGDGNAFDTSGNANHGAMLNGVSYTVGRAGQSFDFDGANDYISIPDSPSLRPASALTVEGWFRFDTLINGFDQNHLVSKPIGSSFYNSYVMWITNGTLHVGVGDSPNSNGTFFDTGYVVNTGVWYHFAMTFDDSANTLKAYVNGQEVGSTATSVTLGYDSHPLILGAELTNDVPGFFHDGQEDEISLYDRALTSGEIASIYNAGIAGKLKSATTIATSNLISSWRGENDATDEVGSNGGTANGATYADGFFGRAFSLNGTGSTVSIPDSPGLNFGPTSPMTVEMWLYRTSNNSVQHILGKRNNCDGTAFNYQMGWTTSDQFFFGAGFGNELIASGTLPLNTWVHVAGVFDGTTFRIYRNGVSLGSASGTLPTTVNAPLLIGNSGNCASFQSFGGLIDEVSIYGRALSAAEVAAQFAATGSNRTRVGEVTVNFPGISAAGQTHAIPLDLTALPALPNGVTPLGMTFDIATSASYSGNASICFNLPGITYLPNFLRIYHLENGAWVNRTASGGTISALCTTGVTSLSPFAIAYIAPTAANVSIAGRVVTAEGRGISNAVVSMTNSTGTTNYVRTGPFGYYKFEDVYAGESCVLTVTAKRFRFAVPSRVVIAIDEVSDVYFVAE